MPRKKPDLKDIEVARRVRALRLEKGLSQGKLGSALGLTFQQIQKYEKGTNRIGAGRLQKIAEVFDVPVAALFGAAPPGAADNLLELADSAAALRMLRAFSRISSPKLKLALATLAEEIAQQSNGAS
jgi:transcriptional regulator with XRE-family HTH domain